MSVTNVLLFCDNIKEISLRSSIGVLLCVVSNNGVYLHLWL